MLIGRLSIALAGTISAAAFSGSVLASTSYFTIYNINRSVALQAAWIATTGVYEDAWHPVSLDAPFLPTGLSRVTVRNTNSCFFDIKVRFSDGSEQSAFNVSGCSDGAAAFH